MNQVSMKQPLVLVWLACAIAYGLNHADFANGGRAPAVPIAPVSAEMRQAVAPVQTVMRQADRAKARQVAAAWHDFASMLPAGVKTTGQLKAALQAFDDALFAKIGLSGAVPGFGDAVEQSFVAAFGKEDVAVDATRSVDFFNALAAACGG
jgi:hypothetical protein